MENHTVKTVYDFGMNNGDDVEYYLKKGCRVVGVEANPALADFCRKRFSDEIASGTFVVLNVALSNISSETRIPFYIHKTNHVLSQVVRPNEEVMPQFDRIDVPQRRASDIVIEHGTPYYIKIDVEHFDQVVLADLFDNNIRPPYVSAESHSIEVFCRMVAAGYTSFNLVDGPTVSSRYERALINTATGKTEHRFMPHAAGPFGDDIASHWLDPQSFFAYLASAGLGWKDVHATLLDVPLGQYRRPNAVLSFREHVHDLFPSLRRAIAARLKSRD